MRKTVVTSAFILCMFLFLTCTIDSHYTYLIQEKINIDSGNWQVISFNMIVVPGGITFPTMIADDGSATITSSYEMAESEVTHKLWYMVRVWAEENGYTFANLGSEGIDNRRPGEPPTVLGANPADGMSWRDAVVWCNALTESKNAHDNSGLELVYYTDAAYTSPLRSCDAGTTATNDVAGSQDNPYVKNDANGYRLPTSNEWELAARYIGDFNGDDDIQDAGEYYPGNFASGADAEYEATTGGSDYDGDGDIEYTTDVAVGIYETVASVMSKSPNALGLYDMSGNVAEWCFYWRAAAPPWPADCAIRGGSWGWPILLGDVPGEAPTTAGSGRGFRVARNAE